MELADFGSWLDRYFRAWVSNDPAEVAGLFAEDAVYSWGPFREPARGREAIVRAWVEGGVPDDLHLEYEALATVGPRGIAHWRSAFRSEEGSREEVDGILVCDFDELGRCTLHQEWYSERKQPL
ncbi:MAG TPA: nuclear transport factor 2 family protein [Actinomycetota bacterium]